MLEVQRVRVHRRAALHLKEVTHRSTSLYAVEVLLRPIRAILVRLVHHIQFQEHRLDLHRMDLGCLAGVGRIHVHFKARHMLPSVQSCPGAFVRTTCATSSPCSRGRQSPTF